MFGGQIELKNGKSLALQDKILNFNIFFFWGVGCGLNPALNKKQTRTTRNVFSFSKAN